MAAFRSRLHDTMHDSMGARTRTLAGFYLLIALLLLARVVYLKTAKADDLERLASRTRTVTKTQLTRRGEILDRNGIPLAQTRDQYELWYDDYAFRQAEKRLGSGARDAAAAIVASLLGMPAKRVRYHMDRPPEHGETQREKRIKAPISVEEEQAVRVALATRPNGKQNAPHPLTGFVLRKTTERIYSTGAELRPVLGRVTQGPRGMLRGIGGLEDWADTALCGSLGWYHQVKLASGTPARENDEIRAEPVNGMDVRTTLDLQIQRIVSEELDTCLRDHTPKGATALVLDPYTGDVLAMVSKAGCSPTPTEEGLLPAILERERNRAIALYEPGSVLKPLTVALALREGVVRPDEDIPCQRGYVPGVRPVRCEAHRSSLPGPGMNTPRFIVAKSCNVATAKLALRLGPAKLHDGLCQFGVLEPTGIQLPSESVGWSLTDPERGRCSKDDLARVGFGQGITVTPLALARAFCAFANGGLAPTPRLVRSYGYRGLEPAKEFRSTEARRVLPQEIADEVRSYLGSVVERGTGKPALLEAYTTGGKTGTAQKVKGGRYSGYIASFIGMVPLTKPRAVIAVVVDEPHNGYHGSQAAAPTWGRIARRLMEYWHVPPDRKAPVKPQPAAQTADVAD